MCVYLYIKKRYHDEKIDRFTGEKSQNKSEE